MASRKKNFYVVWRGKKPGIYLTWAECEALTRGVSDARYKSFPTLEAAESAFGEGPDGHWGTGKPSRTLSEAERASFGRPTRESLCVDAAWNAQSKVMEYRGVWYHDGSVAFERGPFQNATNNIGEFLAIVDALVLLQERAIDWPLYSDSRTAMAWVRNKNVRSTSMEKGETSEEVNELVGKALRWLDENEYSNPILKWETKAWGEVPADYGRK